MVSMSEELYQPLPDIDAYLARIGITGKRSPNAAFLDELIYAHQCAVPFENLDVYEKHLVPSLGIEDLYDKVVVRKRGGYCFELNALFGALLRGLGFSVQPCMARVTFRPNPYPLISHRANLVTVGSTRYLADVGFGGPMPTFAPLVEHGASRTEFGHAFTIYQVDPYWWEVGYVGSKADEQRVLRFCSMPVEEHDFVPLSFFQAQNPGSAFRLHRMVNVKTPAGAFDLRDATFTEFCNGVKTTFEVESDAELERVLAERFGIVDWR